MKVQKQSEDNYNNFQNNKETIIVRLIYISG